MKSHKIFCLAVTFSIILSSCDWMYEPAVRKFGLWLVNNSTDTIGYSVYTHAIRNEGNSVRYILSSYPVYPSDTARAYRTHHGDDDSWGSYFRTEKIDTVYLYVMKFAPEADGKQCNLPDGPDILKIYKFHEGNFDMTSESPVFTYPRPRSHLLPAPNTQTHLQASRLLRLRPHLSAPPARGMYIQDKRVKIRA